MNRVLDGVTERKLDMCTHLGELLHERAKSDPDRLAFGFLSDGNSTEIEQWTYGTLDARARAIAAVLQQKVPAGSVTLLLYRQSLEYLGAFFGCLYAGDIPIPLYPAHKRKISTIQSIIKDSGSQVILTSEPLIDSYKSPLSDAAEYALAFVSTADIETTAAAMWQQPRWDSNGIGYLQYTSGSTSVPKGVMIQHTNIISQCMDDSVAWGTSSESVMVSWMPHFHDFGQVFGILQPLYRGFPSYLMAPTSFVQSPIRWLRAITHFRATHTGAPSFAYDLCVQRTKDEDLLGIDLSSLEVASIGAEPVRYNTLRDFYEKFSRYGLRAGVLNPSYGLAEATLRVTNTPWGGEENTLHINAAALRRGEITQAKRDEPGSVPVVSCGKSVQGTNVVIEGTQAAGGKEGDVGEVLVAGPTVAKGYWRDAKKTRDTFGSVFDGGNESYLRTGDLGFIRDGELYICGRKKDLIIIMGQNYHPSDIELTVESSDPRIRSGSVVAFSIEKQQEMLVIIFEIDEAANVAEELESVIEHVREAVQEVHGIGVQEMRLLKAHSIPKTSSGKLQRSRCKQLFESDGLQAVASWTVPPVVSATSTIIDEPIGVTAVRRLIEERIVGWMARNTTIKVGEFDRAKSLTDNGLASIDVLGLLCELESFLKLEIDVDMFSAPVVDICSNLADLVAGEACGQGGLECS